MARRSRSRISCSRPKALAPALADRRSRPRSANQTAAPPKARPTARPMMSEAFVMRARDRSSHVGRTPISRRYRSATMPPKPRPHGKPRPPGPSKGAARRLLIGAAAGVTVVALGGIAFALASGGDDGGGDARAALEAAGCTLETSVALRGVHSVTTPDGTSDAWNTDPPTSGPHYEVPAIWGSYDEPL